jgi:hypothetical protein
MGEKRSSTLSTMDEPTNCNAKYSDDLDKQFPMPSLAEGEDKYIRVSLWLKLYYLVMWNRIRPLYRPTMNDLYRLNA